MAIVVPTDRPKSVHNRRIIECFGGVFVLSFCPFDISVDIRAFAIGWSRVSFFFLLAFDSPKKKLDKYRPCNSSYHDQHTFEVSSLYVYRKRGIKQKQFKG